MPQLLTVAETAKKLRVDRKTVRRLVKSGHLIGWHLGERTLRIDPGSPMLRPDKEGHISKQVAVLIAMLTRAAADGNTDDTGKLATMLESALKLIDDLERINPDVANKREAALTALLSKFIAARPAYADLYGDFMHATV